MSDTMTHDLKPCPFCGEKAHLTPRTGTFSAFVACVNDDCRVMPESCSMSEEEAVAAWNTRQPMKIIPADPVVLEDDTGAYSQPIEAPSGLVERLEDAVECDTRCQENELHASAIQKATEARLAARNKLNDYLIAKQAEIDGMREALRPFAEAYRDCHDESDNGLHNIWEGAAAMNITIGDLRKASKALSIPMTGIKEEDK